jgi:hypothetical protein
MDGIDIEAVRKLAADAVKYYDYTRIVFPKTKFEEAFPGTSEFLKGRST